MNNVFHCLFKFYTDVPHGLFIFLASLLLPDKVTSNIATYIRTS
jgi:hypothetical protein